MKKNGFAEGLGREPRARCHLDRFDLTNPQLLPIIDRLYAGTLDDGAWDLAIRDLARVLGATGALLYGVNPSDRGILRDEPHGLDPSLAVEYREYWTHRDVRQPFLMAEPVGVPMTEWMMPLRNWRKSEILNEFLLPADLPYFMPVWLHKSPTKCVTLSFQANRSHGPFAPSEIDTLKLLVPHLQRSLEIRDRLEQHKLRADTILRSMPSLGTGLALLDAAGRIIQMNAVFERLLSADRGLYCRADGVLGVRGVNGKEETRWTETEAGDIRRVQRQLKVTNGRGLPLTVVTVPVRTSETSWMGLEPRWVVVVFDAHAPVEASVAAIQADLGISEAEAKLVALLVAGLSLNQAARSRRLSLHTVRNQLKSVFRKTGLSSQSDLVRRALLGPAVCIPRPL